MQHDTFRGYNAYVMERGGKRLCHMGDSARTDASPRLARADRSLFAPIAAYDP